MVHFLSESTEYLFTMDSECLTGFTLLHVHKEIPINIEEIV